MVMAFVLPIDVQVVPWVLSKAKKLLPLRSSLTQTGGDAADLGVAGTRNDPDPTQLSASVEMKLIPFSAPRLNAPKSAVEPSLPLTGLWRKVDVQATDYSL